MEYNHCLLTIVLPILNAERFVSKALTSIVAQAFKNYEVLLLDNQSTDNTLVAVKAFATGNSRFRVISEADYGVYDAMNKGIRLAKGEWIYFMGADDELYDVNVLDMAAKYFTSEYDIVYGDSIWMPENRKEEGEWKTSVFIKANINHQRVFYRKALFEKYGAFNTKYKVAADHELNIRFFCNIKINKIHVPQFVAYYHSGGFSARKMDVAFYEDWEQIVFKNFQSYLPKKTIYGSLGTYIRHLIDKKENYKALKVLLKHFTRTRSLGFVKLTLHYYFKSLQRGKLEIN
jgi:glycosyltransferase involved in cell wall biosynthesis